MMRIVAAIVLHSFVSKAMDDKQDPMGDLTDKLVDKLVDKLFGMGAISSRSSLPLAAGARPQLRMSPMTSKYMQPTKASVWPLASHQSPVSNDRLQGMQKALANYRPVDTGAPSVQAMEAKLKSFGVPSDPFQKLALTALAGTRDVSMAAQAKSMMSNLPAKDKEVIVKAAEAEQMAGVVPPLGFWDPWGLSTDTPEGQILFMREQELKHGRIAMLATLGIIAAEKFSPIFGGTAGVPALNSVAMTAYPVFWPLVLYFIAKSEGDIMMKFGSPDRFSEEAKKEQMDDRWRTRSR